MHKKLSIVVVLIYFITIFSACNISSSEEKNSSSKVKVVVSFNAMREFVQAVGKDKVQITTMIPDGTEPHDFEPKAKDLISLQKAKVYVYNGYGMEAWNDNALKSVENKKLVIVNSSKGTVPIKNSNSQVGEEHGKYDPHLWLSLKNAEIQANNIKNALIKADSKNKEYYEKNYNDFSSQLNNLYEEYKKKFDTVTNKNFVTGHAAFAYFCRDFGLKQNSVEGVFAEGEPSAKKLKELTDYCKVNGIKTIFVEDMVSPKVSDTLAKEVGAKVEAINTIESKEDGKNYIQCMKENLDMIYNSLK